jgi:hypothetical protein
VAFPAVVNTAVTNGSTAAVNATVNLPGSIVAGNTLVVVVRKSGEVGISFPGDWTPGEVSAGDASDDAFGWGYKKADGTEGGTITINGNSSTKYAAVAYQIGNAADPTVTPPESAALAFSASTTPNPPATTPTGGAKDYLWIVAGTWEGEQTSPPTFPANYGSSQLSATSGTGGAVATNCQVHGAIRTNNAASEDPGTFTISSSDDWACWTIAVHPAAVVTYTLVPDAAAYTYTATAATVEFGRQIAPEAASYTYTATDAALSRGMPIDAASAAYAYTASDASLEHGYQLTIEAAAYLYTATDADLTYTPVGGGYTLDAAEASYIYTASDVALSREMPLSAESATYAWTATDGSLEFGRQITIEAVAYVWTASDASLEQSHLLDVASAAYAWGVTDIDLLHTYPLDIDGNAYTWSATSATLEYSGPPAGPGNTDINLTIMGMGVMGRTRNHPHPSFNRVKQ